MFSVILVFNTFFTYNCVKGQNLIKFTSRKGGYNANSRYYIRNPGRDCRSDPGDCVDRGSGSIIVGLDRRLDHCHRWAFFSANKVKKQKEARQAAQVARNTPFMEETAISAIAQGELPVVTGTPVLLEEGEVAHYYAPATKIVTKNKAVGRTGSGAGVRVRVAKGVSVSTGGGSSRTVYGEVTETYSGAIVLTNRRIVFIHNQAGFECKISALTAVTPVDGSVVVQAGSKTYQFSVARQDLFVSALSMVTGK